MTLDQLRKALRAKPELAKGLREYFEAKLRANLTKMVSCEDNNRLHFLRGASFANLQMLTELFEENSDLNTGVRI